MLESNGRPFKLNDEMKEKARHYVDGGYSETNMLPSIAGMAVYLGVSKSTIYNWAGHDEDIKEIMESCSTVQEMKLIDGGLSEVYNSTITKLMMTKHGYSDKIQNDVTTNGESINKQTLDVSKLSDEQLRSLDTIISQASEAGTIET